MFRSLFRRDRRDINEALAAVNAPGVTPAVRAALATFITTAPEREVFHLNANALADQLKLEPRVTLALLAPLTVEGVFNLNWEARCPGCGFQETAFANLTVATPRHTCSHCGGLSNSRLDDEIRVTFTVNDTIRPLSDAANDLAWRQGVDQRFGPVTGHDVLTVQPFRDLFVSEPLPLTESFEVRRLTLLFTDLGGSTALYARKGDPRAYSLVREHYTLLFEAITASGGAVVKTIGDAVMAVFPLSDLAMQAAIGGLRAIERFNVERGLPADEALSLKIGLHSGPCLAVTLNDRLDYFGTTVNAAARTQKVAAAGQLAFTAAVEESLLDRTVLNQLTLEKGHFTFRGLDDLPFTVYNAALTP